MPFHASLFLRAAASAALLLLAAPASAQLAVSANDSKQVLVDGVPKPNPGSSDTVAVIDLGQSPPKLIAEIDSPVATVLGPPQSVAITPDESLALVAGGMKIDPADPAKFAPEDRVAVVDLKARPPRVLGTVQAGLQPTGIAITPDGKLALVTNRSAGTVSVFTIDGQTVAPSATVKVGEEKSGPSQVAVTPDGKTALVTRDADHAVVILSIAGGKVEVTKRELTVGVRPYGITMHPEGRCAVIASLGRSAGDADLISIVDLAQNPIRAVEHVSVPQTPECVMFSPDGKFLAMVSMNGSNKAKASPFYHDAGLLVLFRVDGLKLAKVAEAPVGHWSQGVVFSRDGRTLLVQNMVEKDIWVFAFDGATLRDTKQRIPLRAGGAALRTAGLR